MQQIDSKKAIVSWSLYDWANSAFTTTIMAGFFPIFLKNYCSVGVDATVSTAQLGFANSLGSIIVALLAPILGAIADQGTAKKKFLAFFAFMGVLMSLSLYWVGQGQWQMGIVLYIFGAIGFSGGNSFYDALLTGVASEKNFDKVSALGFSLGYLGGGLLFLVNVWMVLSPDTFGFSGGTLETEALMAAGYELIDIKKMEAVKFSFLTVGIWWGVFSLPILLFVKEPKNPNANKQVNAFKAGFTQLGNTFREIRHLKTIFLFLMAYWLYIDGVDTIVRMAVDYGLALGFKQEDLITALLLTQFVGFPAAIAFGYLGDRIGAKKGILIALAVYLFVCIWGAFINERYEFYMMAGIIGLVQGGVQALSRSYFASMIPKEKSAEYFGFYNMMGKSAAVIGPLLMGGVGLLLVKMGLDQETASRASITSIALLFIVGAFLLYQVDEEKAKEEIKHL